MMLRDSLMVTTLVLMVSFNAFAQTPPSDNSNVTSIDISSNNGGKILFGIVSYSEGGPIPFYGALHETNGAGNLAVETRPNPNRTWEPAGRWVIGGRAGQSVTSLKLDSRDDGRTLDGTMSYGDDRAIQVRSTRTNGATYDVDNQRGGAPLLDDGAWVLGNRSDKKQYLTEVDIYSRDNGRTFDGTIKYDREGPLPFHATQLADNSYRTEVQHGGAWHDEGLWLIGSQEKRVKQLTIKSSDGGRTLTGLLEYSGENPVGFRGSVSTCTAYSVETQSRNRSESGVFILGNRNTAVGDSPRPDSIVAFKHRIAPVNSHTSLLSHNTIKGDPNVLLFITPEYDTVNANNESPSGVYYQDGDWKVINQDQDNFDDGATFNVLCVQPGPNAFIHEVAVDNLEFAESSTRIDHPALNGNPNAYPLVTQLWEGVYNPHSVGVYWSPTKRTWSIYNKDEKPLTVGAKFNVYVDENAKLVDIESPSDNWCDVDIGSGSSDQLLFVTQRWKKPLYNPHTVGVLNHRGQWRIANQDKAPLEQGLRFHVLAVNVRKSSLAEESPSIIGTWNLDLEGTRDKLPEDQKPFAEAFLDVVGSITIQITPNKFAVDMQGVQPGFIEYEAEKLENGQFELVLGGEAGKTLEVKMEMLENEYAAITLFPGQPAPLVFKRTISKFTLDQAKQLLVGKWKGNPVQTAKHSPDLKREDNVAEFTLEFAADDAGLFVERGIVFADKGSLSASAGRLEKGEGVNGYRIGEWNFNFLTQDRIVFEGVVLDRIKTTNSIGMKFKPLPSGTFTMGEEGNEEWSMPHQVTLTQPFELGVYEVTQEQYERVMGTNPSNFKGPQNPVDSVSWHDAVAFCRKLSDLPEEKAAGYVYRLPTDAEWEYACRAGTKTKYSFGDDKSQLDKYAWFDENSANTTHPVGEKKPNPWGLYDMHGNVWEWCQDGPRRYRVGSSTDDPTGPSSGPARVYRGGCWNYESGRCRSADRSWSAGDSRYVSQGFRVLRSSVK